MQPSAVVYGAEPHLERHTMRHFGLIGLAAAETWEARRVIRAAAHRAGLCSSATRNLVN